MGVGVAVAGSRAAQRRRQLAADKDERQVVMWRKTGIWLLGVGGGGDA